jgi:predicted RNA-binding protein with PIN domain
MSSLLEQAIIDAKMLKETARKNAEAAILEQYSEEIKQSIQSLLEQDEPLGAAPADPAAATPTAAGITAAAESTAPATEQTKKLMDKIPPAYLGEDNTQEIDINLESLVEKVEELRKEIEPVVAAQERSSQEVVPQSNPTRIAKDELAEAVEEEGLELEETLEEESQEESLEEETQEEQKLEEEITIDFENVPPGGINASHLEIKKQMAIAKALLAQKEDLLEQKESELSALRESLEIAISTIKKTNEKLKKSVESGIKLKEGVDYLTGKISEVNLLNARLLYTNKTLENASLNERQKQQMAESISRAQSVEEARTIYETLQKTAESIVEKKTAPQSLSEALRSAPSPFMPRKQQPTSDPIATRWQLIAGIKK